jgi:hypothetical protein
MVRDAEGLKKGTGVGHGGLGKSTAGAGRVQRAFLCWFGSTKSQKQNQMQYRNLAQAQMQMQLQMQMRMLQQQRTLLLVEFHWVLSQAVVIDGEWRWSMDGQAKGGDVGYLSGALSHQTGGPT